MTDKNLLVITPHRKEPGKQRIAAYCRVSSRSDEQLNSLTNQINFYRSLLEPKFQFLEGVVGDVVLLCRPCKKGMKILVGMIESGRTGFGNVSEV